MKHNAARAQPEEGATLLVECNPLNAAPIEPVKQDAESFLNGPSCKQHPDAPHSFDINASDCAGRYVCECEGWIEPVNACGNATKVRRLNYRSQTL